MLGLEVPEIIIIGIVIYFLFFGRDKLSDLGKGLGRFTGEFKKGKEEVEKEIKKAGKAIKDN
jgi:sec-independent protein translocase protein TatA